MCARGARVRAARTGICLYLRMDGALTGSTFPHTCVFDLLSACLPYCPVLFSHQALIRPALHENFRVARTATSIYPSVRQNNRLLVSAARMALATSPAAATKFLHRRVQFPSRGGKKMFSTKSVYRYLKQTVSYFYTTIRLTAVKTFIHKVHEYSQQTVCHMHIPPNAIRARLVLTKEEALSYVTNTSFLTDVYAWPALVDALAAVIKRLGGGSQFFAANPIPGRPPLVVCCLGHVAVVAVKLQEHLKRVAGLSDEYTGMNPGHRRSYTEILGKLDAKFQATDLPQHGIRLLDGEDDSRAVVASDQEGDDLLAGFSSDETDGDDDGSDEDDVDA